MTRSGTQRALILFLLAAAACGRTTTPTRKLPGTTVQLAIADRKIAVEVACDDLSRSVGLMNRKSLGENQGMLFMYRHSQRLGFWMKNTHIPLSIAFLDDEGKILQIEDMKPHDESTTQARLPGRYALEMNQGWFARNGVKVGDSFADFQGTVGGFDER
jgi:uncharacterized membrane protein (UPF0127 family)